MTVLPEAILARIADHFQAEYAGVNRMPLRRAASEIGSEKRIREQLELMQDEVGQQLAGQSLLEIGAGIGLLQAVARQAGVEAYGIELDPVHCQLSQAVLAHYDLADDNLARAYGERLPFANGTFDLVCSFLVMEHVQEPAWVLAEAARVLKPGGHLHFVVPNYGSIWEGHYNMPWIPYSPKWLAKLYVSLLGRDPDFVDTLQLINPAMLRRILADLPLEVISWGIEVWEHRLDTLEFSEWSELGRLKQLVRLAHQLQLIEFIRLLGRKFDLFTPIVLTAQRKV